MPRGWRKEPVRHGLAAKGVKTGNKQKWRVPRSFQTGLLMSDRRLSALRLADDARSNLIVGGEVGVLVATAIGHLREGDYEGAYAAFASAREEASEDEPLPGIADDLRKYEIRARNLRRRS